MVYDLQKAGIGKRLSALIFDGILFCILATGFFALISWACNFDSHVEAYQGILSEYETKFGVDFKINEEDFLKLTEEEKAVYEAANKAVNEDAEFQRLYNLIFSLSLTMVSVGCLLAYLVLEFIVPIFFKNGQTLGKKIFGICVMRTNCVRISNMVLAYRTVFGKYLIETMVPIFIVIAIFFGMLGYIGTFVLFGLMVLQVTLIFATKRRAPIHDIVADTVVVDYASQMIFASEEDMIEYKKMKEQERASEEARF